MKGLERSNVRGGFIKCEMLIEKAFVLGKNNFAHMPSSPFMCKVKPVCVFPENCASVLHKIS